MIKISVELGPRSHDVFIDHGALAQTEKALRSLRGRRLVLVSSPRVWKLHGPKVARRLAKIGPVTRLLIPDGESRKTRRTLNRLQDEFVAVGLERDAVVVACGGGLVGDVAGFAAATYMRGLDWVQIPTTLLAMVDASVGGKVGVNHPSGKNLIGAFHQPRAVLADLSLLATLPRRQMQSGAYEILKCGLIGDAQLFRIVAGSPGSPELWPPSTLSRCVAAACRLKAEVVAQDEREGGLRRVLNLGHTLGHALEAASGYRRFSHGEAVGWGLLAAAWLAQRRGLLTSGEHATVVHAVDGLGPRPPLADLAHEPVLDALARDKKGRGGRVPFILPKGIGHVVVADDISRAEIRGALRALARG